MPGREVQDEEMFLMSYDRGGRDRDRDRDRDRGDDRDAPISAGKIAKKTAKGVMYVDYKNVDELRRLMSPNGKIYGRKRAGLSASDQRKLSQAIKRARHMGLLPYTSATL